MLYVYICMLDICMCTDYEVQALGPILLKLWSLKIGFFFFFAERYLKLAVSVLQILVVLSQLDTHLEVKNVYKKKKNQNWVESKQEKMEHSTI